MLSDQAAVVQIKEIRYEQSSTMVASGEIMLNSLNPDTKA